MTKEAAKADKSRAKEDQRTGETLFKFCGKPYPHGWHWVLNGWRLSVQFGAGHYCHNYDESITRQATGEAIYHLRRRQLNAEIAIWQDGKDPRDDMLPIGHNGDIVAGHVSFETIAKLVGYLSRAKRTPKNIIAWCHKHL